MNTDDDLRRDVAFALRRHLRSKRPGDAHQVRMIAAADVIRHLKFCGWRIEKTAKVADAPTTP